MTAEEKKKYNAEYYRAHKDYWRDYYGTGKGGLGLRRTDGLPLDLRDMALNSGDKHRDKLSRDFLRSGHASAAVEQARRAAIERDAYNMYMAEAIPKNNQYKNSKATISEINARRNTGAQVVKKTGLKKVTSTVGSTLSKAGKSFVEAWKSGWK